jgi:thymidylate synthase
MPPKDKDIHKKIADLEARHGKVEDIGDELRIIGKEYADIKSRIEATDVLIDHVIHQLDTEKKMRRVNMLLALAILAMVALLVISMAMGF